MTGGRTIWRRIIDERVVMTVIVVNTLALVARGFAMNKEGASHPVFWVEYTCTLYFVGELAIRLSTAGWRTYWASLWNRVDALLVVVSTPILLEPFIDVEEDIALLLLLRAARLVRLGRLLTFIPGRDRLWIGITRALRAALGVSIALALYCFMLGLAACHLFHDVAPEYFADPLLSFYSMFKVFTVEGWYEIPDVLSADASLAWTLFIRVFFMGAVVTGGLLGLSLANAIFVDEMVMDNNAEVEVVLAELRAEVGELRREVLAGQERLIALMSSPSPQPADAGPSGG
jgi:voltage-gated sodium channel